MKMVSAILFAYTEVAFYCFKLVYFGKYWSSSMV